MMLLAFPCELQEEGSAVSTTARQLTEGAACAPRLFQSTGSSPIQMVRPGFSAADSRLASPPAENPISPTRARVDPLPPGLDGAEICSQLGNETTIAGVVRPCRQVRDCRHEALFSKMLPPGRHVVAVPEEPMGDDHQWCRDGSVRPVDIYIDCPCREFHPNGFDSQPGSGLVCGCNIDSRGSGDGLHDPFIPQSNTIQEDERHKDSRPSTWFSSQGAGVESD